MLFRMEFTPWGELRARPDLAAHMAFMQDVARSAHMRMRAGMQGPHSGRTYRLAGGARHVASAPGSEYPARRSGWLMASIRTEVSMWSSTIGTNMTPYSLYMRQGTPKGMIKRRKMSDTALKETLPGAWGRKKPFARFERG